jgi:hypothetical protein
MSIEATPPRWTNLLLRVVLPRRDFETVAGDLLEEYRETVYPARGRRRADHWFVAQVLGFAWRNVRFWVTLLTLASIARTAMDWLVPTTDFHSRAILSTLTGAGVLLLAGFWSGARSGSFSAGPIIGVTTATLAVPLEALGTLALLAVWHDAKTITAIHGSGGLEEVFTLPILLIVPAVVLGTIGGLLGAVTARLRSA